MMEWLKQNPNAHLTAKERDRASFPLRWLAERGKIEGRVLDYGCGYGADVRYLERKGFDVTGYDPHYAPEQPTGEFDTIFCGYVLNVLFPEQQAEVLMHISELLKFGGKAYFAVRRDVRYEGFRTHRVHKKQTFQCNVTLPFQSALLNDFCEIYEYQHYPLTQEWNGCVFCTPSKQRRPITESATAYAIYDKYPVSEGHALILPKRHCADYFELSAKEQQACWLLANRVQSILQQQFQPDGFNVGINVHAAAGQTVFHAHIHVIPRYKGDVGNPRGGVRGVVPGRGSY
jgi:diadenosine tetraphosphate (Ap4A) HIT family hydrolase